MGQRPRTCGHSRLMAPYPSVARLSWGFEIPQTESALVRVRNAIDVVIIEEYKVSPVKQSVQGALPRACCWRAQATWPTQNLVKHVKRTVAATSESTQLLLSSSCPGCSEAQPDNKWRSTERCRSRSTASKPTKREDPRMDGRDESHQGWGREVGTQPARNPVDFVRRPKEAFLMGP